MKISLEGLQILDAISRRSSFAAAAEELCRVPSTITYAVQKLEEDLGVALFERSGHRPRLTPAGKALLKEGRLILQAAAELEERVKRVCEEYEARLAIGLGALLPCAPLLELAREFCAGEEHAETDLRITQATGDAWDALAAQKIDLTVGASGNSRLKDGRYHTRLIGALDIILAASRSIRSPRITGRYRRRCCASTGLRSTPASRPALQGARRFCRPGKERSPCRRSTPRSLL